MSWLRITELNEKVFELGDLIPQKEVSGVQGKLAHERFGVILSRWGLFRLVPVLIYALSRQYMKNGRGAHDFPTDLVLPEGTK